MKCGRAETQTWPLNNPETTTVQEKVLKITKPPPILTLGRKKPKWAFLFCLLFYCQISIGKKTIPGQTNQCNLLET